MLNRRRFFNILGSAVIGTAIALKLPESIIAGAPSIANGVSYHKLLRAYHIGCEPYRGVFGLIENESHAIYMSENRFKNTVDKFRATMNLIPKHKPGIISRDNEPL